MATISPEVIEQRRTALRRKFKEQGAELPSDRRPTLASSGQPMTGYPLSGPYAYRELVEGEKGYIKPSAKNAALLALDIAVRELGVSTPELVFMTEERRGWAGVIEGLAGPINGEDYRVFRVDHKVRGARFAFRRPQVWVKYNLLWNEMAQTVFHEVRHIYQWEKLSVDAHREWYKADAYEADADAWADSMLAKHWELMSQAVINVTRRAGLL